MKPKTVVILTLVLLLASVTAASIRSCAFEPKPHLDLPSFFTAYGQRQITQEFVRQTGRQPILSVHPFSLNMSDTIGLRRATQPLSWMTATTSTYVLSVAVHEERVFFIEVIYRFPSRTPEGVLVRSGYPSDGFSHERLKTKNAIYWKSFSGLFGSAVTGRLKSGGWNYLLVVKKGDSN